MRKKARIKSVLCAVNVDGKLKLSLLATLGVGSKSKLKIESICKIWDSNNMAEPIKYYDGRFDTYTLKLENQTVKLDCYLKGSVLGGTGTECSHTISGDNVSEFLKAAKVQDFSELEVKARKLGPKGWQKLHLQIIEFQTESWSWSETDWSD